MRVFFQIKFKLLKHETTFEQKNLGNFKVDKNVNCQVENKKNESF